MKTAAKTLLALTANSPYWEGTDTGYASYRFLVFSRWPTFCTPEPLGDWAGYEALVRSLIDAGAIDSPKRLYWTARPSSRYPTIELRIADVCATADEAVMVAGLARALVATALDDLDAGRPVPDVRSEVLRVVRLWVRLGIRTFRVDNPHTKPVAFWEWLIHTVNAEEPDVVFLAEAFTRPAVMRTLAKAGFQQSYSYFTWRNTKDELEEFLT